MTHSPLPYTANGESLLDARGNVIATFRDYRDADACVAAMTDVPTLRAEVERLEDKNAQLKDDIAQLVDFKRNTRDAIDDALRFVRSVLEALKDDFATLDATIGELVELKESLDS